ncbi:MICOS complex subunit MIC26 isoform X2 [Pleurodeles waltl]|uniref:MICOS complex subunit MIC26 isoform X2 n=1 Tax=Pleurodeles waltl TaxID=8319 RepID=UPI003709634E
MTNQDARPSSVNDLTVFSFLALKEVCPWLVPLSLMFATNARENMLKAMRLTAVPASMGLLSFQVYASNEKETPKQEFQKVDELSMYTSPLSDSTYVEDKPTQLEESISWLRHSIAPYSSKCQDFYWKAKPKVETAVEHSRGSKVKRIVYPLTFTGLAASLYYPQHAVTVAKGTGSTLYDWGLHGYIAVESLWKDGGKKKKSLKKSGEKPEAISNKPEDTLTTPAAELSKTEPTPSTTH